MDATGIAALIGAIVAAVTAMVGGAASLYRFAKAQAKSDLLQEQSQATILAKGAELEEVKAERDEWKAEVMWLRSQRTAQQEKSQ